MTDFFQKSPLIFNIYKPEGITSFDVIRHFKRLLPKKSYHKIGHFGTLDPFADGVFLMGFNGALRLNDLLHETYPKTYLARGILGRSTDTGDKTGNEIFSLKPFEKESLKKNLSLSHLQEKAQSMLGEYFQAPPAYSASKHEGKNLYEWAREGIFIEKEKKRRFIHAIEVVSFDFPEVLLRVSVSSGTYIRTLFEDFAKDIGVQFAYLENLKREKIGNLEAFHHSQGILKENWDLDFLKEKALTPDKILPYPSLILNKKQLPLYANGNPLSFSSFDGPLDLEQEKKYVWIYSDEGTLLGLSRLDHDLKICKIQILF